MFRKIHSNRDPRDTLFSEISREFSVYIQKFKHWFSGICLTYPKAVYSTMILLMIGSAISSFLFLQTKKPVPQKAKSASEVTVPVKNGFGQILEKGLALQEAVELKTQIEMLIAKDSLTSIDSVSLEKAIDRLHMLSIKNQ